MPRTRTSTGAEHPIIILICRSFSTGYESNLYSLVKTIEKIFPFQVENCRFDCPAAFVFAGFRLWFRFHIPAGRPRQLYSVSRSGHHCHGYSFYRGFFRHRNNLGQAVRIFERNSGCSGFANENYDWQNFGRGNGGNIAGFDCVFDFFTGWLQARRRAFNFTCPGFYGFDFLVFYRSGNRHCFDASGYARISIDYEFSFNAAFLFIRFPVSLEWAAESTDRGGENQSFILRNRRFARSSGWRSAIRPGCGFFDFGRNYRPDVDNRQLSFFQNTDLKLYATCLVPLFAGFLIEKTRFSGYDENV